MFDAVLLILLTNVHLKYSKWPPLVISTLFKWHTDDWAVWRSHNNPEKLHKFTQFWQIWLSIVQSFGASKLGDEPGLFLDMQEEARVPQGDKGRKSSRRRVERELNLQPSKLNSATFMITFSKGLILPQGKTSIHSRLYPLLAAPPLPKHTHSTMAVKNSKEINRLHSF